MLATGSLVITPDGVGRVSGRLLLFTVHTQVQVTSYTTRSVMSLDCRIGMEYEHERGVHITWITNWWETLNMWPPRSPCSRQGFGSGPGTRKQRPSSYSYWYEYWYSYQSKYRSHNKLTYEQNKDDFEGLQTKEKTAFQTANKRGILQAGHHTAWSRSKDNHAFYTGWVCSQTSR